VGRGVPIEPAVRAAIVADLRATVGTPEGSIRRVAERHGVSRQSIVRIAADEGVSWSDEGRHKVENAVEARRKTNAELRSALAERLLGVANRALSDMDSPAVIYNFGGKDNSYNERTVERPPTADQRNLATIAAIAIDKHKVLDMYDADARSGAMLDRWLGAMIGEDPNGSPPAGR
jgi:transposase-like protein